MTSTAQSAPGRLGFRHKPTTQRSGIRMVKATFIHYVLQFAGERSCRKCFLCADAVESTAMMNHFVDGPLEKISVVK